MRLRVWALAALLAAGAMGAGLAQDAKPTQEPKPAQIDRNGVLILIRSSLLALVAITTRRPADMIALRGAPESPLARRRPRPASRAQCLPSRSS